MTNKVTPARDRPTRPEADEPGSTPVHCARCRKWIAVHGEQPALHGGVGRRGVLWMLNGKGESLVEAKDGQETFALRCRRCHRVNIIDAQTGVVLSTVDDDRHD